MLKKKQHKNNLVTNSVYLFYQVWIGYKFSTVKVMTLGISLGLFTILWSVN